MTLVRGADRVLNSGHVDVRAASSTISTQEELVQKQHWNGQDSLMLHDKASTRSKVAAWLLVDGCCPMAAAWPLLQDGCCCIPEATLTCTCGDSSISGKVLGWRAGRCRNSMRATVLSAVPLQAADMPSSTAMVVASCWSDRYLQPQQTHEPSTQTSTTTDSAWCMIQGACAVLQLRPLVHVA